MGKNIKFQFTLPYKCCFYVNYLQRLIQLIYETRHPHVHRLWFVVGITTTRMYKTQHITLVHSIKDTCKTF